MHDPINPSHYADGNGIECIEAIEASMSVEEFKGFLKGNCQKYLWRFTKKSGAEDLKKAKWYLERLITIQAMEEGFGKAIENAIVEGLGNVSYDPDDYMASGCPDGFCPLPGVRQGPSEAMFSPMCDN